VYWSTPMAAAPRRWSAAKPLSRGRQAGWEAVKHTAQIAARYRRRSPGGNRSTAQRSMVRGMQPTAL
jgi:hypothetical protein